MSHVAKIKIEIRDLGSLDAACRRLEGELLREQAHFNSYQQGLTCDHAIRFAGCQYEVGVTRRAEGGYDLSWDDYAPGGLLARLGTGAGKLVQAYGVEAATRAARRQGYAVTETAQADGSVVLHVRAS